MLEINNLENVSENIRNAIQKAETDAKIKVNEFVISSSSPELFFESSNINFVRDNEKEIDEEELHNIFKDIVSQSFRNNYRRIKNLT
ncbi:MAG: hypothetical protein LBU14_06055 [Candidatus Peribacteria bacterium]|nr:hypothetical protein [Candidatus Peribacteria bacterium]